MSVIKEAMELFMGALVLTAMVIYYSIPIVGVFTLLFYAIGLIH
jgi:hypothetical protein